MEIWLFLASLVLTVWVARGFRQTFRWQPPARTYRSSVLTGVVLTSPAVCWMYLSEGVSAPASLLTVAGALTGGVVTTSSTMGFVEDNAPPSTAVREKVLAYHSFGGLCYPPEPRLKRTLDVALALTGLIATLPLWIIIAAVIWIEEPGPILFTKNSVGKGGITFRQIKFRSMKYEAERLTGPVASSANDARALRCGRWLRRWQFDELPELLNVLTGRMSLVGPRPLRTVLVQGYLEEIPGFAERHAVKPGIACIAQIQKYHISPAERLRKDRVYIRRMSVGLDIRLLWRAVTTTVRGTRRST
jgi:lipopolysaccharide/colanic/teichoic acid biosynthesis glycosyltransferase